MERVFFTSGGSEAVEAAWKLAREHFLAIGQPQRTKAIARDIAYHGVTLGALSFTGVERFKEPFGRPAIDVTHVSNTNMFRGARRRPGHRPGGVLRHVARPRSRTRSSPPAPTRSR